MDQAKDSEIRCVDFQSSVFHVLQQQRPQRKSPDRHGTSWKYEEMDLRWFQLAPVEQHGLAIECLFWQRAEVLPKLRKTSDDYIRLACLTATAGLSGKNTLLFVFHRWKNLDKTLSSLIQDDVPWYRRLFGQFCRPCFAEVRNQGSEVFNFCGSASDVFRMHLTPSLVK